MMRNLRLSSNLPEEIIIYEILSRLPVKFLLKFKSVSKSWFNLISSHEFAKSHLKFSTKKNDNMHHDKLLFGGMSALVDLYTCSMHSINTITTGDYFIYPRPIPDTYHEKNFHVDRIYFDYPLYRSNDWIWLVGSCNGLVCVAISATSLISWNPVTRCFRVLEDSGTNTNNIHCGITYGFGYDELHDDYKVVECFNFFQDQYDSMMQVKVYSLRSNSSDILTNWPGGNPFSWLGIFFNGAFHWSITYSDREEGLDWDIVSHDLSTNTFAELPLPYLDNYAVRVELVILEGCLSACCEHRTYMDVWVMKEYGVKSSWTKSVHIPFQANLAHDPFFTSTLLFMMDDGKMLINYRSSLRIYDPGNPHNHVYDAIRDVDALTYFESLLSPNMYVMENEVERFTLLPSIPEKIIYQILLRLPVKSLLKFRCVSIAWLLLISSSVLKPGPDRRSDRG